MHPIYRLLSVVILFLPASQLSAGTALADEPQKPMQIAGTEWVGEDNVEKFIVTYRFEKNGILAYTYRGTFYRNGTWTQNGEKVYFELNNKFRELEATIEGEVISGKSWNKKGETWRTTLYKYNKPQ